MTDSSKAASGHDDGAAQKAPADYIEALEALLDAARRDDAPRFTALLDDLAAAREQTLFQDVGRLTRQLHEALTSFQVDSRVADFASDEFPDARHRLDQVITITEQSAHKTMDLVEDMLPRAEALIDRATSLGGSFDNAGVASGSAAPELATFVNDVGEQVSSIRSGLSEVIISQNYQDLAGQEIRKVIRLVTEVEETLINMIRVAGKGDMLTERRRAGASATLPEGEQRITSQDEADELLSSLGF
ncbi:protein phosphatase CheZ [Chromatocurvus halotolerans]|uniref:Protein phosphatase CheZ n=1 Tax=Chromatocurvus halotolerans TaxID=1132028 RepID=A0A4R2KS39_9GAMM|nr:protein phosphatase CheZ [Chromatocurvus halotolerans]TCO76583.1 chemotaxis phosphatase CheZ [Chromatocurvus halotolerans]